MADPNGGTGLDLIRWQRGKAGTVEHAHHVLTNELAAEALPSRQFAADAAWFRLNVMPDNLLSAFKRIALPPELHAARPKRLRLVLLNGIRKVVRHRPWSRSSVEDSLRRVAGRSPAASVGIAIGGAACQSFARAEQDGGCQRGGGLPGWRSMIW